MISSSVTKYWSVILCSVLAEILVVIRVVYSLRSGFMLNDEAVYFLGIFSDRFPFQWFIECFKMLVGNSVWTFLAIMPIVNSLFAIGSLYLMYRITKKHIVVVAMFLSLTFLVNLPFVLADNLALFVCLFGIFSFREDRFLISILCFAIVPFIREAYVVFTIGYGLYLTKELGLFRLMGAFLLGIGSVRALTLLNWANIERVPNVLYPHLSTIKVSLSRMLANVFANYLFGLILGLGVILYFVFRELIKMKDVVSYPSDDRFLFVSCILALMTFFGTNFILSKYGYYNIGDSSSTMIRLSHSVLPALVVLKDLNVSMKKLFFGMMAFYVAISPFALFLVQNNLSENYVNRADFVYKTPWLILSDFLSGVNGKTLIVCEPILRAELFTNKEDAVFVLPSHLDYSELPLSDLDIINLKEEFYNLISGDWKHVYFYGEKHRLHDEALKDNNPEYFEVVNETLKNGDFKDENVRVSIIWNDEESYLLEVKKIG